MIGQVAAAPPRDPTSAGTGPVWHSHDGAVSLSEQGAGIPGWTVDIVDEWGRQSFPASDPPANW